MLNVGELDAVETFILFRFFVQIAPRNDQFLSVAVNGIYGKWNLKSMDMQP